MEEGPYVEDPVEDCLEEKAWACIQEIEEVPESFEEFVSADVNLVCPKSLQIMQSSHK